MVESKSRAFLSGPIAGLLLGIGGGLLGDAFQDTADRVGLKLQTQLAGAAVCFLCAWLFAQNFRKFLERVTDRNRFVTLGPLRPDDANVRKARAIIVFISLGSGSESARSALQYHCDRLEFAWLLATSESNHTALQIKEWLQKTKESVSVEVVSLEDPWNVAESYRLVERLRTDALRLVEHEMNLICDFSGAPRCASGGMVLACAPRGRRLQYMHPNEFNEAGHPVDGTGSTPREVNGLEVNTYS